MFSAGLPDQDREDQSSTFLSAERAEDPGAGISNGTGTSTYYEYQSRILLVGMTRCVGTNKVI